MDPNQKMPRAEYQPAIQKDSAKSPQVCCPRDDDNGLWNIVKAWYTFLIHLMACAVLTIYILTWIDGRDFQTGSPPSLITPELYQTQVTGLISLALVALRLVAGSCSALLIWRTVWILLNRSGLTLAELLHLCNYRVPIMPCVSSLSQFLWSCWVIVVVLLPLLPGVSAPLANSSIAWTPSVRLSSTPTPLELGAVEKSVDWRGFNYYDWRMITLLNAATMASNDPAYAFDSERLPLRRYFTTTQPIATESIINLDVPYFNVSLRWIDAKSTNLSQYANLPKYLDVNQGSTDIRIHGSVGIIRNETWNSSTALPPKNPGPIARTLTIALNIGTVDKGNESTQCAGSETFGTLPNVDQALSVYSGNGTWHANDCFLMGEASIVAGSLQGVNCTVSAAPGPNSYAATCAVPHGTLAAGDDWLAAPAVDFMSEALKYTMMLNATQPWMHDNIDGYAAGLLRLGYHATWSVMNRRMGINASATSAVWASEPVVRAVVDRPRLAAWLGMNAALALAAALVAAALAATAVRTVRDPTLAAVALDLTPVTHGGRAPGLCGAVALPTRDRKLPRLRWEHRAGAHREPLSASGCRNRVVFTDDVDEGK